MKDRKYLVYLGIEIVLFVALLVFQIIDATNGYRIYSIDTPTALYRRILQISTTGVSFLFALLIFLWNKNKKKILFDLFTVYFFLIFVADIFFSGIGMNLIGHFGFLAAYLLLMVMRKARLFEYLIVAIVGGAGILILHFLGKLSAPMAIDFFLGAALALNAISSFVTYGKTRDKNYLLLGIAVSLILLSDLSIAARTFVNQFSLNVVISLITWPTYIAGNVLLNYFYKSIKELEN